MARIVIPGAGIGGMSMAYEMHSAARAEDRITVVSKDANFHFVPSNSKTGVRSITTTW